MIGMDKLAWESQFYLTESRRDHALFEADWGGLSRPEEVFRLLETYRRDLGAAERDVAATFFASLLGSLCAGFHYAWLQEHAELTLAPGSAILQFYGGRMGPPMLVVLEPGAKRKLSDPITCGNVKEAMERFYGGAVRPVIEMASLIGRERVLNLWRLLAARLKYLEEVMMNKSDECTKEAVRDHFEILYKGLSPSVFRQRENPLDIAYRYVEDPAHPGQYLRQRPACCLAFKTGGNLSYCHTCPRLKLKATTH